MTKVSEFESQEGQEFSLPHVIQISSEVHPTYVQWLVGALSVVVKQPKCEADQSPPTSAEVKKMWVYASTSSYIFIE
jgi:hypothetical protein